MPDDLFYPVGVVTCIVVFEAHHPHPAGFKTFFGYFKNDGFLKTKHLGRIERGAWPPIRKHWLDTFINRENVPGLSVLKAVTGAEEWCAEAYIETDYSMLDEALYAETVKRYVAFQLLNAVPESEGVL
jgi:hypothetical protein